MEKLTCMNCFHAVRVSAGICPNCGQPLGEVARQRRKQSYEVEGRARRARWEPGGAGASRTLLLLAVVYGALFVSNPAQAEHEQVIRVEARALIEREHPIGTRVAEGVGRLVGIDPVEVAVDQLLRDVSCDIHLGVISTCEMKGGGTVSVGIAGRVWAGRDLRALLGE